MTIPPDDRKALLPVIKQFFRDHMDEDIGDLKAAMMLDYILKEIAPSVYNQAVQDAQKLMREQRLSRKQARARALGLAERLERVRRLGGGRPLVVNSAYRTRAYNASLDGSATNSAHTRGFAADTSPPRGVTLEQHRQHVLEAFECGVGLYPAGRGYFVHGDFDHTLGGRRVW